ncbi:aminoglycoside phosphotransferase family protein [Herbaspirillum lusitanum]|uniref:phosphotransferase enzyme family protein n=1 Tax=Herbaspirillum lusitanum TaxID=213312 RepID=UPI0022371A02|nr:phosphotransferase [Herbaspirillum lusitanum]MCW5297133.1 aminoglycoside phosphotransferase family protein [Herbaspirillum lusitanum]
MEAASHHLTRVLSHGMNADAVISDWPALTSAEVARVLLHYPQAGVPKRLVWHSPRPFSAGCVMTTSIMDVFVKRHHVSVRDVAGLSEEHGFINHLRSRGIAVSEVLTTSDGATAFTDDHWTYEVHGVASGVDLYRDAVSWTPFSSSVHAHEAGKALARLHLAAQDYAAPARKARTLVSSFTIFSQPDPLPALQRYIERYPAIADYLKERDWRGEAAGTLLPFHARLLPYLDELTPLWTHNDWHASNLLWTDRSAAAGVETILDFGLSDRTCALHDLATAIERNVIEWLAIQEGKTDAVHPDLLDALLDGYHLVLPLSSRQWLALAALLPLVHAEFALAELAYFHGITRSANNAALAYDAYYLGHAAWFNSADGQRLLARIEQRAAAD